MKLYRKLRAPLPIHFLAEPRDGMIQEMESKRLSHFYLHKYPTHVGSVAFQQSSIFLWKSHFSFPQDSNPQCALFRTTHLSCCELAKISPSIWAAGTTVVMHSLTQDSASLKTEWADDKVTREINGRSCLTPCLWTTLLSHWVIARVKNIFKVWDFILGQESKREWWYNVSKKK